jgi:hypothetical protein
MTAFRAWLCTELPNLFDDRWVKPKCRLSEIECWDLKGVVEDFIKRMKRQKRMSKIEQEQHDA